jgi:3-deoxy-D-manno-octulosonic-acid transferase
VRNFLERLRPSALLLIETEIWPNILRECRRSRVPVALLNGRISDKHFPRYARWRKWLRPVIRQLSAACVQNSEFADRLAYLGMEPHDIHVTGNTKFDAVTTVRDETKAGQLRRELGFESDCPVLIFGSTRAGDDALAARCWQELQKTVPRLRLIVAPRHVDRLQETLVHFNESILLRSQVVVGKAPSGERIVIVDTLGELVSFYAIATVAVVGGSFYPGVNGHNPLEPAALGVPTVFGPYMRNFADPARELVNAGGARQVASDAPLPAVIYELLANAKQGLEMAAHAKEAILRNQGAIERTLQYIEPVLFPSTT